MKDLRGYMTEAEVKRIYEATDNQRDKLLIRVLWVTGARISEVVGDKSWKSSKVFQGLRAKDIDFREGVLFLETLKRREYPPPRRRVPVDKFTLGLLKQFVETDVLENEAKVFNMTRQRANQILRGLCEKVGIKKVGDKKPHMHHLRHSHCVNYIKHNNTMEGLRKLQTKMGHANIGTTAHYLQFAPEEQKEVEDVFGKW
jgi:integrase/recombinase XerD